jgi:outer membrane lipoprotein LolB
MRWFAALPVVAALAGCAAAPTGRGPIVPANPELITSWTASGRLAVAANGEGGSGSFTWEQRATSTSLSLRGPLGAGAVQVRAVGDELRLNDDDGRTLDDAETRAFLRNRLGAELPWSDLRYWMLGVPAPDDEATVSDGPGVPVRVIEQAGWRIAYDSFQPEAGVSLPARFVATRPGVRVKVMVDDWRVAPDREAGP